jgi:glycosyltransferase involved in cell wall biosynthesis
MISVLMPAHKYHNWLESAIESVLNSKTEYPFELIVVANNMCSIDLDKLSDLSVRRNFRLLKLGDKSMPDSLNVGLSVANFELIARLDSDDFMRSDRLQIQADFLNHHKSVVLLASAVTLVDHQNVIIGRRIPPLSHNSIKSSLRFGNCLVHPSIMFRRSAALQVGGYTNEFPFAEDFDLYMRMIDQNEFGAISLPLTAYRVFDEQISAKNRTEQLNSSIRILNRYFAQQKTSSKFQSNMCLKILKLRSDRSGEDSGTFKLTCFLFLNFVVSPIRTFQFLFNSLRNFH